MPSTFLTVDEMTKSVTAALFSSLLVLFGKYFPDCLSLFDIFLFYRCRFDYFKPIHTAGSVIVIFYDGFSLGCCKSFIQKNPRIFKKLVVLALFYRNNACLLHFR